MTEEQVRELLQKYLDQQASPLEIKKVDEWYVMLEDQDVDISKGQKAIIGKQILLDLKKRLHKKDSSKSLNLYNIVGKVAALLLVFFSLFLIVNSLINSSTTRGNLITIQTGKVERKHLTLSDGSKILLEPNSNLAFSRHFALNSRNVILKEGSAFFEIVHEENRPFIVHTSSNLKVAVLGTSFRINAFKKDKNIEVSVMTGKVAISSNRKLPDTLIKNEKLKYDLSSRQTFVSKIKNNVVVSIPFDGATLEQVITKLEYIYSVKIHLSSASMGKLKCTAIFNSGQNPEEILSIICSLHHFKLLPSMNHKIFKIYK
jgi:transmembrane sensor